MATNNTKIVITAEDKTAAAFASAKAGLDKFSSAYSALGGLAGAGLVAAISSTVRATIDFGDEMNDLSQKVGISVKNLATWKLAAEQSGTSLESVAKGVKGLSTYMVENGAALRAAGINATEANGALIELADLFSAMPDGVEKTALAVKLFGKAGMDMLPMLNLGSAGMQEAQEKAKAFGERMELLAPQADKFNDELAELALQSKAAGINITSYLLPGLTGVATWLNDLVAGGQRAETALEFLGEKSPLARGLIRWNKFINGGEARSQGFTGDKNALGLPLGDLERQTAELAAFDAASADYMKKREARQRAQGLLDKSATKSGATKKEGRPFDPFADFEFKFAEMNEKNKRAGFDETEKALQRETEALAKRAEAIKDAIDPTRALAREIGEVNKARDAGLVSTNEAAIREAQLTQAFNEQHGALKDLEKSGKDSFDTIRESIENMGNKAADTFADMLVDGKASFTDLVNSWVKDLARLQAKKALDPITKGAGDWLGDLFSGGFYKYGGANLDVGNMSANGNAFDASGVIPFANGGVVTRPTLFPFAQGTGLMGEAGPEAILPLERGAGGKLGVRSSGGGGTSVVINAPIDARGADASVIPQINAALAALEQRIYRNVPGITARQQMRNRITPMSA